MLCFIKIIYLLIRTFREVYKNVDKLNIPNVDWAWNFNGKIFLKSKDKYFLNKCVYSVTTLSTVTNYIAFADYLI